ncbi:MAG: hypothetical protein FJ301_01980 [Planctomycetes bacterium]|nr:hypothetical protein [Planctomycetota bacterium]
MRRQATLPVLLAVAACSAPPPTVEQRAQAEFRLLAPFLVDRVVGCRELRIELTSNFYGNVGRPAHDPQRHSLTRVQGDGFVETVWTNRSGAPEHAFVLAVGATQEIPDGSKTPPRTRFRVVNQLRIRVYEDRRPLTLAATASDIVLVQDGKSAPRDVSGFVIEDGAVRPQ